MSVSVRMHAATNVRCALWDTFECKHKNTYTYIRLHVLLVVVRLWCVYSRKLYTRMTRRSSRYTLVFRCQSALSYACIRRQLAIE